MSGVNGMRNCLHQAEKWSTILWWGYWSFHGLYRSSLASGNFNGDILNKILSSAWNSKLWPRQYKRRAGWKNMANTILRDGMLYEKNTFAWIVWKN